MSLVLILKLAVTPSVVLGQSFKLLTSVFLSTVHMSAKCKCVCLFFSDSTNYKENEFSQVFYKM